MKDTLLSSPLGLKIITPSSEQRRSILWMEIESSAGEFTVAAGHAPLICALKKEGRITFQDESEQIESIKISDGVAYVEEKEVTLILFS